MILSYDNNIKLIKLNPQNGNIIDEDIINSISIISKIIQIKPRNKKEHSILFILDEKYRIFTYPPSHLRFYKEILENFYFYILNKEKNIINGYKIVNNTNVKIWGLKYQNVVSYI